MISIELSELLSQKEKNSLGMSLKFFPLFSFDSLLRDISLFRAIIRLIFTSWIMLLDDHYDNQIDENNVEPLRNDRDLFVAMKHVELFKDCKAKNGRYFLQRYQMKVQSMGLYSRSPCSMPIFRYKRFIIRLVSSHIFMYFR